MSVLLALLLAPIATAGSFQCNGSYGSFTCEHTLYVNNCKHWVKIKWPPLLYPGAADLKNKKRAWCSVIWNSAESTEERKFEPARCERLIAIVAAAHQGFPEIPWQESSCTHFSTNEGVLYSHEIWEQPTKPLSKKTSIAKRPAPDPEPKAVRLEDLRTCTLHNPVLKREKLGANAQTPVSPNKVKAVARRTLKCEVLSQPVFEWARKFLGELDVSVELKNPLR